MSSATEESAEIAHSDQVTDTGVEADPSRCPGVRETKLAIRHQDQIVAVAYDPNLRFDAAFINTNIEDLSIFEIAQESQV